MFGHCDVENPAPLKFIKYTLQLSKAVTFTPIIVSLSLVNLLFLIYIKSK